MENGNMLAKNFPALGTGVKRIVDSVYEMSDGNFEIKVYSAGELVPPFEVFDAVRDGIAEIAHDAPYYWVAKHSAMPFFTSVPGGLTAPGQASWIYLVEAKSYGMNYMKNLA